MLVALRGLPDEIHGSYSGICSSEVTYIIFSGGGFVPMLVAGVGVEW